MESGDQNDRNNNEMWNWPGEEDCLQRDSQNDFSRLLWDDVNQNELFCMLDEQTPVKDCTDLEHQSSNADGNRNKCLEDYKESLQLKRRRMLQFAYDTREMNFASEQVNTAFFKSKVMECSMTGLTSSDWNGDWSFNFQDDSHAFSCEELDHSSHGWLTNCFNENASRWSFNELKNEVVVNKQADISECYSDSIEMETDLVLETPVPAPLSVSKNTFGKEIDTRAPRKPNISVAYPFALIKPCGVHGDLTLNDINQRMHAPPPSSLKHKNDEDPSITFPMSAFSGKPVVVKTKIHTEGGHGSITILRTKG